MPQFTFQAPTDQPSGQNRLLDTLVVYLSSGEFTDFKMIVAFAKSGPLLRLEDAVQNFHGNGGQVHSIFGIDEKGTSYQALELALNSFDSAFVARIGNKPFSPTFHSKIYMFSGATRGIAIVGSNNLTVGGTETNAESYIGLDFALPQEAAEFQQISSCWNTTLQACVALNTGILQQLHATGLVESEKAMRMRRVQTASVVPGAGVQRVVFPNFTHVPPSSIPAIAVQRRSAAAAQAAQNAQGAQLAIRSSIPGAQALVIQITPHHNGEIFLSKIAVNQNPVFFGFPFTGNTVPKKATNASYPQRTPDPVVEMTVYDATGAQVAYEPAYSLRSCLS